MPKTPTTGNIRTRIRNRESTEAALQQAFSAVKNSGKKISIRAVALEAQVDPSLIHHAYPEIAEQIRAVLGIGSRSQRDQKHQELVEARKTIVKLRANLVELTKDIARIASVNLSLSSELVALRAELDGKLARLNLRPPP